MTVIGKVNEYHQIQTSFCSSASPIACNWLYILYYQQLISTVNYVAEDSLFFFFATIFTLAYSDFARVNMNF